MVAHKKMSDFTPPPPKTGTSTSPWVWVGIGCGTAVLLTFGGCVAIGLIATQHAVEEFRKPVDSKTALAKLENVPIYKPSTFNELKTKEARLGASMVPAGAMDTVAFDTSDPPSKVMSWYEQQFASKGYRATPRQSILNGMIQVRFQNQAENVVVQARDLGINSKKDYTFILIRMKHPTGPKQQ
jgi:hypothetical protein